MSADTACSNLCSSSFTQQSGSSGLMHGMVFTSVNRGYHCEKEEGGGGSVSKLPSTSMRRAGAVKLLNPMRCAEDERREEEECRYIR